MVFNVTTVPSMALSEIVGPIPGILKLIGVDPTRRENLLRGFDDCAKPGEMDLVIGRPGAGCSTFLRTIAPWLH